MIGRLHGSLDLIQHDFSKTIPVYVVSVKTFVDRHKHMADLKRLGIKFEYVWAYALTT